MVGCIYMLDFVQADAATDEVYARLALRAEGEVQRCFNYLIDSCASGIGDWMRFLGASNVGCLHPLFSFGRGISCNVMVVE